MNIQIVERAHIEDKKWNGCVHFSINSRPYAYTWYLDQLAPNWFGLVYGNYKAVFPIVWNKKMGIHYIYTPHYVQQLGLYTSIPITPLLVESFYKAIPKKFRYIDLQVNENAAIPLQTLGFTQQNRVNYLLNLKCSYTQLKKSFSGSVLKNLKKAGRAGYTSSTQIKPEVLLNFYKQHTAHKIPGFSDFYFHALHRIIYKALFYNIGFLVAVHNKDGHLVAVNFFIKNMQRIFNLLSSTSNEGRKNGAMHFLLDTVIRQHADKNILFDFEGSMIEGVAKFYQGFGTHSENYTLLQRNTLPFPLNKLISAW